MKAGRGRRGGDRCWPTSLSSRPETGGTVGEVARVEGSASKSPKGAAHKGLEKLMLELTFGSLSVQASGTLILLEGLSQLQPS